MAHYNSTEQDQPLNIEVNNQMFHQESQNVSESGFDIASGNTTQIKYDNTAARESEQGYYDELYKVQQAAARRKIAFDSRKMLQLPGN